MNLVLCIDVSYGTLYLTKSTEYDFILSRCYVKCTDYCMKATKWFGKSTQYFIDYTKRYVAYTNYYVKVTFYITKLSYYHIISTPYCVLCINYYIHTYLKTVMAFHSFWHVRPTNTVHSLIRVFVLCILRYPKCAQWRFWSDCASAQSDQNLRWVPISVDAFFDVTAHILMNKEPG